MTSINLWNNKTKTSKNVSSLKRCMNSKINLRSTNRKIRREIKSPSCENDVQKWPWTIFALRREQKLYERDVYCTDKIKILWVRVASRRGYVGRRSWSSGPRSGREKKPGQLLSILLERTRLRVAHTLTISKTRPIFSPLIRKAEPPIFSTAILRFISDVN